MKKNKTIRLINLANVTKVTFLDISKQSWYYYKARWFFGLFKADYFESVVDQVFQTKEELMTHDNEILVLDDNTVVYKPRIIINYVDGSREAFFFDTYESMVAEYKTFFENMGLIDLTI